MESRGFFSIFQVPESPGKWSSWIVDEFTGVQNKLHFCSSRRSKNEFCTKQRPWSFTTRYLTSWKSAASVSPYHSRPVAFWSLLAFEQLQGPHHQRYIRCLSGVWSGTTLHRASVQLSKPSDATYSARPVGQPGCGRRLPQPGQIDYRRRPAGLSQQQQDPGKRFDVLEKSWNFSPVKAWEPCKFCAGNFFDLEILSDFCKVFVLLVCCQHVSAAWRYLKKLSHLAVRAVTWLIHVLWYADCLMPIANRYKHIPLYADSQFSTYRVCQ